MASGFRKHQVIIVCNKPINEDRSGAALEDAKARILAVIESMSVDDIRELVVEMEREISDRSSSDAIRSSC